MRISKQMKLNVQRPCGESGRFKEQQVGHWGWRKIKEAENTCRRGAEGEQRSRGGGGLGLKESCGSLAGVLDLPLNETRS